MRSWSDRCASGVHVTVMGVSGSGKSSVATALARALGFVMIEGDEHHPPQNVAKMGAGIPLTDADRRPWLEELAILVATHHARGDGTILACSALKRSYRETLRSRIPSIESFVVELDADIDQLRTRMGARSGHYMPTSLLGSQLATLEHLRADTEVGKTIDAGRSLATVTGDAIDAVSAYMRAVGDRDRANSA